MDRPRRDESPSGLSDIVEQDGLLGTGITVRLFFFSFFFTAVYVYAPRLTLIRAVKSRPLGAKSRPPQAT